MIRPLSAATALLALALLVPSHALAQKPADARLKALIGKKAKASKKAKPAPTAQLSGGKDEDSEPTWSAAQLQADADEALLHGLLFAFEPAPREIRAMAIGDLALLGDPRALDPLAHLTVDPDPVIATAAVRAVGHFQHPRAEEILAHVVELPSVPPLAKTAAIDALPFQATDTAHALLTELSRSTRISPPLRSAAKAAADAMTPPRPTPPPAPTTTSQR